MVAETATHLMLLAEAIEASLDLSRPPAITRQVGSSNLCVRSADPRETHLTARVMSQVGPVDLVLAVIICVNKLVSDRVLHVPLAVEAILTQQDPMFW